MTVAYLYRGLSLENEKGSSSREPSIGEDWQSALCTTNYNGDPTLRQINYVRYHRPPSMFPATVRVSTLATAAVGVQPAIFAEIWHYLSALDDACKSDALKSYSAAAF